MNLIEEILKREPKAKDIITRNSECWEYTLFTYRVWNKKHTIKLSNSLFDLHMAGWHKEYDPLIAKYSAEISEATAPIEKKYRKQLDKRQEEKEKLANEYITGRIDKYFNEL